MNRLWRKLPSSRARNDTLFVIFSAFALRAAPFIAGAALLRTKGAEALAFQNIFYVHLNIITTVAIGGLTPFLLYGIPKAMSDGDNVAKKRIWDAALLIFNVLFVLCAIIQALIMRENALIATGIVLGMYFTLILFLWCVRLNAEKSYRDSFLASIIWVFLTITLAVILPTQLFGVGGSVIAAYIIGSFIAAVFLARRLGGISKFIGFGNFNRTQWWNFLTYEFTQILTVVTIFAALEYERHRLPSPEFSLLIFSYQLYSAIIFIPGIMTNVIVPRLVSRQARSKLTGAPLIFAYASFAILGVAVITPTLNLLATLYGFNQPAISATDYFIVACAIPSCLIAALNQDSIVRNAPSEALLLSATFGVTLLIGLSIQFQASHFGLALFVAFCLAALARVAVRAYFNRQHLNQDAASW